MFYVVIIPYIPCCPALAKSKRVPSPVSGSSIMYWSPEVPGTPWWSPPSCKTTVFGPPGPGFCVKTIPAVGSEPPEVRIGWVKKTCWPSVVVVSKLMSGQVCFRSNRIKPDYIGSNFNKFDFLLSKIFIRLAGHHASDFSDVFWHKMRIPPLQKIVPKSVMFGNPAKKSKNGFILCSDWNIGYFWTWNYLELGDFNIFKANWLIPTSFSSKMKIKFASISVKCRNSPIYEFI